VEDVEEAAATVEDSAVAVVVEVMVAAATAAAVTEAMEEAVEEAEEDTVEDVEEEVMAGTAEARVDMEVDRAATEVAREAMVVNREDMEVVEDTEDTELYKKKKNIVTSKTFFPRIPISNFDFSVFSANLTVSV